MSDAALLLGIDTSRDGDLVLAQLAASGELTLLAQQQFNARDQSAELLPRLARLLADSQISLRQLSAIVVVHGPGSFTGLRIGLAAVKGLAHATKIPVIAISSLEVLASLDKNATAAVLVAGRAEYYLRMIGRSGSPVESLQSESDLAAALGQARCIVADSAMAARLPATQAVTTANPGAFAAVRTALPRFLAGDFDDLAMLDANYVRAPYTERAAAAKQ